MSDTKKKDNVIEFKPAENEEASECVKKEKLTTACDCESAPPANIYQLLMSRMTPEVMAGMGVKLIQVNGDELFWMTSVGQLYPFNAKKEAILAEYTWLMSEPK